MSKIIAEKIWAKENTWNGKAFTSYTAGFQGKYYSLKGYKAAKVVEGQPLEGIIEEYQYEKKDKETKQPTGEMVTGYNFHIFDPVQKELSSRLEKLEKIVAGTEPEKDDEDLDPEDIPY